MKVRQRGKDYLAQTKLKTKMAFECYYNQDIVKHCPLLLMFFLKQLLSLFFISGSIFFHPLLFFKL